MRWPGPGDASRTAAALVLGAAPLSPTDPLPVGWLADEAAGLLARPVEGPPLHAERLDAAVAAIGAIDAAVDAVEARLGVAIEWTTLVPAPADDAVRVAFRIADGGTTTVALAWTDTSPFAAALARAAAALDRADLLAALDAAPTAPVDLDLRVDWLRTTDRPVLGDWLVPPPGPLSAGLTMASTFDDGTGAAVAVTGSFLIEGTNWCFSPEVPASSLPSRPDDEPDMDHVYVARLRVPALAGDVAATIRDGAPLTLTPPAPDADLSLHAGDDTWPAALRRIGDRFGIELSAPLSAPALAPEPALASAPLDRERSPAESLTP